MNFKLLLMAVSLALLTACQGPRGDAGQSITGPSGANGSDSIVELIDPCNDGPGNDEVILRLSDGRLLSYFKSGTYEFLTVLGPGSYRTTDQQACNFTVDAQGNVNF